MKPICDYRVNPKVAAPVDRIPQHLANLPPDPGPEGKLTIDGIDSDKDGMRDDVQRWIATEWGHSEVAVKALTIYAQGRLFEVHHGDELGREKTRELGPELMRMSVCMSRLETPAMREGRAYDRLGNASPTPPSDGNGRGSSTSISPTASLICPMSHRPRRVALTPKHWRRKVVNKP